MRLRHLLGISLAISLGGCHSSATGAAPAPGSAVDGVRDRTGLVIPQRVGPFVLQPVEAGLDPTADVPYRFRDSSTTNVTVFVYDIPEDVRRGDDAQGWAEAEGMKFPRVLALLRQRGAYQNFTIVSAKAQPATRDGLTIPGYAVTATTRRRGQVNADLEYVYVVRDHLLKVRATVPEQGGQPTQIPRFADALALAMARP